MTFSKEPAVYIALADALLVLAISFGLPLTADQKTLIIAALVAASGILTRTFVTPAN